MIFIIFTQKNRPVEEILFDHNHEDMNANVVVSLWKGQKAYRKSEILCLRIIQSMSCVLIIWAICRLLSVYPDCFTIWNLMSYTVILYIFQASLLAAYCILAYLLRKYHMFEYKK